MREFARLSNGPAAFLERFGDSFDQWAYHAHVERDRVIFALLQPESHLEWPSPLPTINIPNYEDPSFYLDPFTVSLLPNTPQTSVHAFHLFVEQRRKTVGMISLTQLLELSCGIEFPPEILRSDIYKRVLDDVTLLIGLVNELVSLAKDIRHYLDRPKHSGGENTSPIHSPRSTPMWTNLVLLHCHIFDQPLETSIRCIAEMHNEAVRRFDRNADLFIKSTLTESKVFPPGWTELVSAFCYNVRLCVHGLVYWHVNSPRYMNLWPVDIRSRKAFWFQLSET